MKKTIVIFLYFALSFTSAQSLIKVDITRGNLDPLPIAISPLYVDSSSEKSDLFDIEKLGIKILAISSNDVSKYPEDSFENMVQFSKKHNFNFPYAYDETQEVAKKYDAVCTPDFFGFNKNFELQYRGRHRELKDLKPTKNDESELLTAMKMIAETNEGPKNQSPSMGCNIKWF